MKTLRAHGLLIGLAPVVVLLVALNYHLQDDAFISFRYAFHLKQGWGSVWNPCDHPSFGYTNLLWTLLLAYTSPVSIETWSVVLSALFLAGNILVTRLLFLALIPDRRTCYLFFLAFATNHTLVAFGTSGLETSMNGFLWTLLIFQFISASPGLTSPTGWGKWLILSLLACLVLLSRPDGIVLLISIVLSLAGRSWSQPIPWAMLWKAAFLLLLLPTAVFLFISYKVTGMILPIPFFAKTGGGIFLKDGFAYLTLFFAFTSLWIPGLLFAKSFAGAERSSSETRFLALTCLLWCSYLVYVGGDFMEFRMMVPVLPALYLLSAKGTAGFVKKPWMAWAVVCLLTGSNLLQGQLLGKHVYTGWLLPVRKPVYDLSQQFLSFEDQGLALKKAFGKDASSLRFAIGNAGIVPYRSELQFVDIFGLTDLEIAREGLKVDFAPGHRRLAKWSQLKAKGVNLLILRVDHKKQIPPIEELERNDAIYRSMKSAEPQMDSEIVRLALTEDFLLTGLYITQAPEIEKHILFQ